jgi:23S rRNA pseudouridine1911/1915/1917 synthase
VLGDFLSRFRSDGVFRLDLLLVDRYPELGRSRWSDWVRSGYVKVDGEVVIKPGTRVRLGSIVETCMPPASSVPISTLEPEDIELPTVFEDEYLWVIDKPAGIVVHPGPGHSSGTILNALLGRLSRKGIATEPNDEEATVDSVWPGLVHRIDRYTTGCLVVAKDANSQRHLQLQFKNRTVNKRYLALVRASSKLPDIGFIKLIDKPIARHQVNRLKMAVSASGRSSQTRIKTLAQACGLALVECDLLTGRTHQIRLHLSQIGAPILGDSLYGGASLWADIDKFTFLCSHPMLHSWKLSIKHPKDGVPMDFIAPLSTDYRQILFKLGILPKINL